MLTWRRLFHYLRSQLAPLLESSHPHTASPAVKAGLGVHHSARVAGHTTRCCLRRQPPKATPTKSAAADGPFRHMYACDARPRLMHACPKSNACRLTPHTPLAHNVQHMHQHPWAHCSTAEQVGVHTANPSLPCTRRSSSCCSLRHQLRARLPCMLLQLHGSQCLEAPRAAAPTGGAHTLGHTRPPMHGHASICQTPLARQLTTSKTPPPHTRLPHRRHHLANTMGMPCTSPQDGQLLVAGGVCQQEACCAGAQSIGATHRPSGRRRHGGCAPAHMNNKQPPAPAGSESR